MNLLEGLIVTLLSSTSINDKSPVVITEPINHFQSQIIKEQPTSINFDEIIEKNIHTVSQYVKKSLNFPERIILYSRELGRKSGYLLMQKTNRATLPTNKQVITSAIVLDLNHNGIESIDINSFSYFDFEGNGLRVRTAWVSPNDGLLVYDYNNDGMIKNGLELFGHNNLLVNSKKAANGFEALAKLDINQDGKIDKQDPTYTLLQVWQDSNSTGTVEKGELKSLAELNIISINTTYKTLEHIDSYGNKHLLQATITFSNGAVANANNIWFKTEAGHRIIDDTIKIPTKVAKLPNAKAFGKLYDLHQAMVLDPLLIDSLHAYLNETDREKKSALLDLMIYRWAGVDLIDPHSRDSTRYDNGHFIDARQLITLELLSVNNFMGTWQTGVFDPNPHHRAAPLLLASYNKFKDFVAAQLYIQTELKGKLGSGLVLDFNDSGLKLYIIQPVLEKALITLFNDLPTKNLETALTHLHNIANYSTTIEERIKMNLQEILERQPQLKSYFSSIAEQNTIEKTLPCNTK